MKQDWVWMPHAGHLIIGDMCKFHLNTYVNGYIVSTLGELWLEVDSRRLLAESRIYRPKLFYNDELKKLEKKEDPEIVKKILELKGDDFDRAYLSYFGYEDLGLNRKYESMVLVARAAKCDEDQCCPWRAEWESHGDVDFKGYNNPKEAFDGHMELCEKWDKEVHASQYKPSES